MSEPHPDYPHNIFPSDILRRVLGNLPAPHPKKVLAEVNAYHADLYKDEPVPGPVYPVSATVDRLKERLDKDQHSVIVDVSGVRDYSREEIEQALQWHVEQEYAEQLPDGDFRMTDAGLAALQE